MSVCMGAQTIRMQFPELTMLVLWKQVNILTFILQTIETRITMFVWSLMIMARWISSKQLDNLLQLQQI
nr:MAG TPA: hypothetical protein [Caudoviricetes sp.]